MAREGGSHYRNPKFLSLHQKSMPCLHFRRVWILFLTLPLAGITACTSSKDNPDEIRQRTAEATETIRRDAKAAAEGAKEGMGPVKTININKEPREDLLSLPDL